MITDEVQCPSCGALYLVDDETIIPPGLVVKCGACGTSWRAGHMDTVASGPVALEAGKAEDDLPPILAAPDVEPLVKDLSPIGQSGMENDLMADDPPDAPPSPDDNEGVWASPSSLSLPRQPGRRGADQPPVIDEVAQNADPKMPPHREAVTVAAFDAEGSNSAETRRDPALRRGFGWSLLAWKSKAAANVEVKCPSCSTTYRVSRDDAAVEKRLVECSKCHHEWIETFGGR